MSGPYGQVSFFLYNTTCSISLREERGDAAALLAGAKEVARHVRRLLDFYDPDSELGRLNRDHRVGEPYPVSEELCRFLAAVLDFSHRSGGCFDPTVGSLVRLWDIPARRPVAPAPEALAQALERTGTAHVRCDEAEHTVTVQKPGILLDAGAAGKGYAVDAVAEYLVQNGVAHAAVNFGGNLRLIGGNLGPGGERVPWRVGVQAPWRPYGESLGRLLLTDRSVATSGGYDRYFEQDGKTYHHLLDPRTGRPVEDGPGSVTIVSPSALVTDLLSTACFVGGEERLEALCGGTGEDTGYLLVRKDGTAVVSPSLGGVFHPCEKE